MSTLALTVGGAALGTALLPTGIGIPILGATLSGAAIGGAIGGIAGSYIDNILFAPSSPNVRQKGPRIEDLRAMGSTEGAAIPRVFGRMRISTQLIWTTRYREEIVRDKQTTQTGGKGLGGGGNETTTTTVSYLYYASFAVGLCEGPILGIGRIWADGRPLIHIDNGQQRLYRGTENQEPDPKIEAVQGNGNAPAYRGLAYLVFEDLPLAKYGNRIPQISVEVIRPAEGADRLEEQITAIVLIPGSTEFGYDTEPVFTVTGIGGTRPENRHREGGKTDCELSLDALERLCPNLKHVSLVVAWHGTDLRCGSCEIRPKVESADKQTKGAEWRVSGIAHEEAEVVSQVGGSPAIGGAPSDGSILRLIRELRDERGWKVTLYPFVMMDIPAGNGLPDPYGGDEQARYPWRGRITCDPAPGQPGTVDKTSAAADQVDDFFGSASPNDFEWHNGQETVLYDGPGEWSFRRHILHYATLAAAAGGVDAFLIGSELVGLTTVRSDVDTYPAVSRLRQLASDVREIFDDADQEETKISYAADWTEYGPHRPDDGSGDVFFHLDPLWADNAIDFVGIDNYFPLADWRDGTEHLDADNARSIYERDYLRSNIEGGELFDWYYADAEAREEQDRSPITDGAYGEPWVHRIKDVRAWWRNEHRNRPGGVRDSSATEWVPESKPIRFTEIGCPAIDKGANQPNVFVDPKSSESFLPFFSDGSRDETMQRAYLEALLDYWADEDNNPESGEYDGRMIARSAMAVWCWDARPYPDFPDLASVWADAGNWRLGHWLTGRLGQSGLAAVVEELCAGFGVEIDTSGLNGTVKGYLVDRIMSPREALAPLGTAYQFDGAESDGAIVFQHRRGAIDMIFAPEDLVIAQGEPRGSYKLIRAQESELPRAAKLKFVDGKRDYRTGAVESRRLVGDTARIEEFDLPILLEQQEAQGVVDAVLAEAHAGRERIELTLPPSALALDAADVIALALPDRTVKARLGRLGWEWGRPAEAIRVDDGPLRRREGGDGDETELPPPDTLGPALLAIMDLPLLDAAHVGHAPYLAAYADPWSPVAVRRSEDDAPPTALDTVIAAPSVFGETAFDFHSGPVWRWDRVNHLYVDLPSGAVLASASERSVLDGANAAALLTPSGEWEIVQWCEAELVSAGRYRLSKLLRGQLGTEHAMGGPTPAGSRFVRLDSALSQADLPRSATGTPLLWAWGPAELSISDRAWRNSVVTVAGTGLRPYAPVRLAGARNPTTGDWTLSFIRRTRIDGDSWNGRSPPLGEEEVAYLLEILDGGTGVRSVELDETEFLYTAAMQTEDFGSPQMSVAFRVAQESRSFGYGTAAEKTATV